MEKKKKKQTVTVEIDQETYDKAKERLNKEGWSIENAIIKYINDVIAAPYLINHWKSQPNVLTRSGPAYLVPPFDKNPKDPFKFHNAKVRKYVIDLSPFKTSHRFAEKQ